MKTGKLPFIALSLALGLILPCGDATHAATQNPLSAKRDNKTPIEITADALEVLQEENRAIFTGHVVAVQGDLRLSADNMTVHYNPEANKKTEKANTEQNAIRKIDALGNVLLATPEETASGNHGVYDVQEELIKLTGVVKLTRGKNILEGDVLTYSFVTGKSKLASAATAAGERQTGSGKRVRALFVPAKDK